MTESRVKWRSWASRRCQLAYCFPPSMAQKMVVTGGSGPEAAEVKMRSFEDSGAFRVPDH